MTREAIAWLDAHLDEHRGLSWGAGNGTCWLAQRSSWLIAVEHDVKWARRVRDELDLDGADNVELDLVDEAHYLEAVEAFPDEHFDYVVVDGLFRDGTLLRSIPKLRGGGFLVLDNVNWYLPSDSEAPWSRSFEDGYATQGFARAASELAGWAAQWTTNGLKDTAIFVKPSRS